VVDVVLTVQVRLAGVESVLPAESVALTSKVWLPFERPVYSLGEVQAPQEPLSSLHSKLEPLSEEEKLKLAELLCTVPEGPESMVVSGGVVSPGLLVPLQF